MPNNGVKQEEPILFGTLFATTLFSQSVEPLPLISYFAKFEISIIPTPLRNARHSLPTGSNQFWRSNQ